MKIQTNIDTNGIISSLYQQQLEQANELCDEMAQKFWPMIGTANQTAYIAMDDAVEAMRECGMLKQQVKVKAIKALAEYEAYDKAVRRHFQDMDDNRYFLWADLVARAADRLQPDVDKLYYSIKNKIDEYRCKDSIALAKIQTALAMVTLSTLMYDTMANQFQRQTMIRIARTFRGGRLTAVESNWRAVGELTGKMVMPNVNLRDDPNCALGIQVILTRYQSADFLNEAAKDALDVNPEIKKEYENQ